MSPVPDERDTKRIKRYTHYGLAHQPVDLREGVAKAYTVVKEVKKINVVYSNNINIKKNCLLIGFFLMFPCTGDHRHSTDHL